MNGRRIYHSRRELYQERISAVILLAFYLAVFLLVIVTLRQIVSIDFDDILEGINVIATEID